jgi:hypothetical protein
MPSGPFAICLACKREISEFEDQDAFMQCPKADDYFGVILNLMPSYSSREECVRAMTILDKGGYDISVLRHEGKKYIPMIPIIRELAKKLMRYEAVEGERFHESAIVCASCVTALCSCSHCGHERYPACPVCDTKLVPTD